MKETTAISQERFKREVEDAFGFILFALRDGDTEEFPPALILGFYGEEEGERRISVVMMPDFNNDTRMTLMSFIGRKFGLERKPVCLAILVAEGWLSEDSNYVNACDDPRRKEIINVQGMTYDGRIVSGYVTVERDEGNHMLPSGMGEVRYGQATSTRGSLLCKAFFKAHCEALEDSITPDEKKMSQWN